MSRDPHHDTQLDGAVDLKTKRRVVRPPMYRVILHNDDYTTQEFVVLVLMRYFYLSQSEAIQLMLRVHKKGQGSAGVFPYDIALTKKNQVERLAAQQQMPLRLSVEPETSGPEGDGT